MAENRKRRDPVRAAFARLNNPYVFDECQYPDALEVHEFFERRAAHIRALEDPYASLSIDAQLPVVAPPKSQVVEQQARPGCSKADFQAGCRAVFSGYVPALERGKLRDHHRDFIRRNEGRSPEVRYSLLAQLKKYDLSSHPGLSGQFNRERDIFTEQKLRVIERDAEESE